MTFVHLVFITFLFRFGTLVTKRTLTLKQRSNNEKENTATSFWASLYNFFFFTPLLLLNYILPLFEQLAWSMTRPHPYRCTVTLIDTVVIVSNSCLLWAHGPAISARPVTQSGALTHWVLACSGFFSFLSPSNRNQNRSRSPEQPESLWEQTALIFGHFKHPLMRLY